MGTSLSHSSDQEMSSSKGFIQLCQCGSGKFLLADLPS